MNSSYSLILHVFALVLAVLAAPPSSACSGATIPTVATLAAQALLKK